MIAGLVLVALGLHWRDLWAGYWGDEATTIYISGRPLGRLPQLLRQDGAPPLYYGALHIWMSWFGPAGPATHALSLVAGLASIPAAWWAGQRLWGRRAAALAAALVGLCAYLGYYSTETRMYAWVALLALLAVANWALALSGGQRRPWLASGALVVCLLYLHNYGLYLLAAMTLTGLWSARRRRSVSLFLQVVLWAGACLAAFSPWLPVLAFQARHTGAPWAPHPSVADLVADPLNALASAAWPAVVVAIAVAVVAPRAAERSRPSPERSPSRLAIATAVPLVTIAIAFVAGQSQRSWDPRYLGIAVVPGLLALAGGLARARWGGPVGALTAVALAATAVPKVAGSTVSIQAAKSDLAYISGELKGRLRPGALVVCERVNDSPLARLYFGPRDHYAGPTGPLRQPGMVDWVGFMARLRAAQPARTLRSALASVPPGAQVVLVSPTTWGASESPAGYTRLEHQRASQVAQAIREDPRLRLVAAYGVPKGVAPEYPVDVALFVALR